MINGIEILKELHSLKENFIKSYNFKKLENILNNVKLEKFPIIENLNEFQIRTILEDVKLFEILTKLLVHHNIKYRINPFTFEENFIKFINGEILENVSESELFLYELALKIYGIGFKILWTYLKKNLNTELFDKNYCPICGFDFEYTYIDNEMNKFLVCGLCDYAWKYPYNKCPFCESSEGNLKYFYLNDNCDFLQICECGKCNKFHKVLIVDKINNYSSLHEAYFDTLSIF